MASDFQDSYMQFSQALDCKLCRDQNVSVLDAEPVPITKHLVLESCSLTMEQAFLEKLSKKGIFAVFIFRTKSIVIYEHRIGKSKKNSSCKFFLNELMNLFFYQNKLGT